MEAMGDFIRNCQIVSQSDLPVRVPTPACQPHCPPLAHLASAALAPVSHSDRPVGKPPHGCSHLPDGWDAGRLFPCADVT